MNKAGIILNKKKCKLFRDTITILGRIVKKGIVMPDPEKVNCIKNYKIPQNIRELRSFLGILNFCREFIPQLCNKAAPLYKLLEGGSKKKYEKKFPFLWKRKNPLFF